MHFSPSIPRIGNIHSLPPGSFCEEAALDLVQQGDRIIYHQSFAEIMDGAVQGGPDATGLLGIQNMGPEGSFVHNNLVLLYERARGRIVHIGGEYWLHVNMCLGGLPGTRLQDITKIASFPTAIGQCRRRLAEVCGRSLQEITVKSTVEGVSYVQREGNPRIATLASQRAIEANPKAGDSSTVVLADNMADLGKDNQTQFLLVQAGESTHLDADRRMHAGFITARDNCPGTLHNILVLLKNVRANLVSLYSMCIENEIVFFVEMTRTEDDVRQFSGINGIVHSPFVKAFTPVGSWDFVAGANGATDAQANGVPDLDSRVEEAGWDTVDPSRGFHSLYFVPHNRTGVLADITGIIGAWGINILSLQSRPLGGRKCFGFNVNLDSNGTNAHALEECRNALLRSGLLQSLSWETPSDASL